MLNKIYKYKVPIGVSLFLFITLSFFAIVTAHAGGYQFGNKDIPKGTIVDWTGVTIGGSLSNSDNDFSALGQTVEENFYEAGIWAEVNKQIGRRALLGVRAEYLWSLEDDTQSWNVLAKAGYKVTSNAALYVIGGWKSITDIGISNVNLNEDTDGVVYGGGIEVRDLFAPKSVIQLEVQKFNEQDAFSVGPIDISQDELKIRLGLGFQIN